MQDSIIVPVHSRVFHFLPGTFHTNPSTYGAEQGLQTAENVIFRELTAPLTFLHFRISSTARLGNEIHHHLVAVLNRADHWVFPGWGRAAPQPWLQGRADTCQAPCALPAGLRGLALWSPAASQRCSIAAGGKGSSNTLLLCHNNMVRAWLWPCCRLPRRPHRGRHNLACPSLPVPSPALPRILLCPPGPACGARLWSEGWWAWGSALPPPRARMGLQTCTIRCMAIKEK